METYIKDNGHVAYRTHAGVNISPKQYMFLCYYVDGCTLEEAMNRAGYKNKDNHNEGIKMLQKPHIAEELKYLMDNAKNKAIADRDEILQFFTRVMRGEEKDQFGLDTPVGEKTRAAVELAKRTIDVEDKLKAKEDAKITISLEWARDDVPQLAGDIVLDSNAVKDITDQKELGEGE